MLWIALKFCIFARLKQYEISEDLYKMIKDMIGDKIPVDEQVESSYVIHGKKR